MNGARWALVTAAALWVAVRVTRNVTGGATPRGRGRLKAASGAAGPVLVKVGPARKGHPVLRWTAKRIILAAHLWPRATAGSAAGPALALWAWLLVQGVTWWAGLVLALPGLALAGYALARARKTRRMDPWATLWARLSDDVVQDGRVVTKAVLPGSKVQGRVIYDRADTGTLRRVGLSIRGYGPHQTLQEVRAKAGAIAAAYLVPASAVEVVQGQHNAEALVWVTMREWLAQVQAQRAARQQAVWPLGAQILDRATGLAEVAVQLDTGEPAHWETYRPGVGSRHGVIGGDTRYGKSKFLEGLTVVQARSGLVVPAFIDLAGGVTFEPWEGKVQLFADNVRDAEALMAQIDRIYEDRIRHMKVQGWRGVWRYSEQDPAIVMKVDEGPELKASKKASALLSRAVRLYGKAGIGVEFASQSLTIESILGREAGSAAKSQMMAGNLAAFYANQGLAGLPFDASDVPMVAGVCRLYGPQHPQSVLVRGLLVDDDQVDAVTVPTLTLPASACGSVDSGHAPVADEAGEVLAWGPGTRHPAPLHLVPDLSRDPDPEARIRAVLRDRGPQTTAELVAATRLSKTRCYELLPRMRGVEKSVNYGGRWSLIEEKS